MLAKIIECCPDLRVLRLDSCGVNAGNSALAKVDAALNPFRLLCDAIQSCTALRDLSLDCEPRIELADVTVITECVHHAPLLLDDSFVFTWLPAF